MGGNTINIKFENSTEQLSFSQLSDLNTSPHLHKEIEILYVVKGTTQVYIENRCCKLQPKDLIIIFPNQVHVYDNTNSGVFDIINFSIDLLYGIKNQLYRLEPQTNVLHIEDDSDIQKIVKFLLQLKTPYMNTAIVGVVNVMVSLLLPQLELKPITHSVNNIAKNIINYCLNNYTTNISLDLLASELHVSKYYISNLFNRTLKISFNDYINNLRITEACHQLLASDKKIADISQDVGFGSIRSFNSAFKRFMKITPKDYRAKAKFTT